MVTRKRVPFNAVLLSLIMPGLGHVYCGRIVKGLALGFLSGIFVPLILLTMAVEIPLKQLIIFLSLFGASAVGLVAIIDSFYIAKHTREDYELKDYNRWYVYLLLVVIGMSGSLELAFNIKANYIEAFRGVGLANYPTILPGDRFLVNKMVYKNSDPKRGDLIVFLNPEKRHQNNMKRIVAVSGDTIEIKDGQVYVNDEQLEREKIPDSSFDDFKIKGEVLNGQTYYEINSSSKYKIFITQTSDDDMPDDFSKITIPKNHFFVLADNRSQNNDSRVFGSIPLPLIKGRADYLYSPAKDLSRIGKLSD